MQCEAIPCSSIAIYLGEEVPSHYKIPPSSWRRSPLSLLQTDPSQLPHPLPVSLVLQTPFVAPLWIHSRASTSSCRSGWAAATGTKTTASNLDPLGPLANHRDDHIPAPDCPVSGCHWAPWPPEGTAGRHRHPQTLFLRAALQPFCSEPVVTTPGVSVAEKQHSALVVKAHAVAVSPVIQPMSVGCFLLTWCHLYPENNWVDY